jgi:hypothetical protein
MSLFKIMEIHDITDLSIVSVFPKIQRILLFNRLVEKCVLIGAQHLFRKKKSADTASETFIESR